MRDLIRLRRPIVAGVVVAALLAAMAACSSGKAGSNNGSPSTAAATGASPSQAASSNSGALETLNFGVGSDPSTLANGIYLYAMDHGIFKKHGLNFNIKYLTPAAVQAALLSGDVDAAYDGDGMFIASAKSGGKVIMTPGPNAFAIFAKKQMTLKDLKGKTVASSTPGGAFTSALQRAIRGVGLNPTTDVHIVYLQGAASQFAALKAGKVDAAVLSPPTTVEAKNEGFVKIADVTSDVAPGVVAANAKFYAAHKDALEKYVAAMKDATQAVLADPAAAAQSYLKVNKTVDPKLASDGIAEYLPYWQVMPYPTSWAKEILQKNPATKAVDPATLIDNSFVEKAGQLPPKGGSSGGSASAAASS